MPTLELETISACVRDDLEQVERLLREGTRSIAPLIPEVGEHTFSSGGKRVRPLLVLLAAKLCGYRGPRAIQVASAVECLHTATLLHDDVVDGADTRRGRASVNARWGDRLAVLVGDFLLARASQTLVEDGNADILWSYSNTIRQMAEGEVLQLARSFDPDMPESLYLEVIGRKTSSLLATATESGAILASVTRAERRAVRDYGWKLGLAFQLVDDALDYAGDGSQLGKTPLTDLAEGKVTLPLILTLKRCTSSERASIHAALKQFQVAVLSGEDSSPTLLDGIAELVSGYRGVDSTLDRARKHVEAACAEIAPFEDCEARSSLNALALFVVERKA